jgi:predicted RecB family nuclease
LPLAETSIYFDIEGIPGHRFQYLFGMLIVTEAAESFQSFWANDTSEQSGVLVKFCESLSSYSNATLFHYGNYERKALKDIRQCIGHEHALLVDRILGSSINVLTILHRYCYFPTYSNRLKDIAGFLGYNFNNSVQSGIRSIIFRERWEETADHVLKDELISYNKQDCQALKTVYEFVRKSTTLASAGENIPGRDEKVHFAESLRKVGEGNRPIFRKAEFACPEF